MIRKQTFVIISLSLFIIQSANAIEKIVINGLFKDKAIVTIDGKQRVLKKGKVSPEGALLIESNSKEAIIKLEQKAFPLNMTIKNKLSELHAPFTKIGAKIHTDQKLELKKVTLSMEINSQKNIDNLISTLKDYQYIDFEDIWNGKLDV